MRLVDVLSLLLAYRLGDIQERFIQVRRDADWGKGLSLAISVFHTG